jgi:nitrate reductase cytochrome c-type subunit
MKKFSIGTLFLIFGVMMISSCNSQQDATTTDANAVVEVKEEVNYLEVGKELALETKSNLGKNLAGAITEKGSEGAVKFCNIQAIPITDSMSLLLGAQIKRVSDQPRNPDNHANVAELAYITKWKEAHANGTNLPPMITEVDQKMIGYYPITTNPMCMQCHGTPGKDINAATLAKITKLYPSDKATGYGLEDLRGIFVVEMNKN